MASNLKGKIKNVPKKNREFGVILESIDSNVKHIVEVVDTHTKQVIELQNDAGSLKKDMAQVKDNVAVVKTTFETVNLIGLQKRVMILESKGR